MRPKVVLVNADLHKGFGDWVIALPAMKLLRDRWGAYLELIAISPGHLLPLVEMAGIFDQAHPYRLDWCEYYADLLDGALAVVAMMDSDMYVYEDVMRRTEHLRITQRVYRNKHWRIKDQHHALMVARNLDVLLGYDPTMPLQHPLTRWQYPGERYVAIHAGRGSTWRQGAKDWPYFYHLCKLLEGAGWTPLQIIGPDETPMESIQEWRGSIRQLADTLLHCVAFIGNDSGPGHLAGALGVPTHTIFGETNPLMWHPIGPRVTWSSTPSGNAADITVAEVFAAVRGKLAAYENVEVKG